MARIRLESMLPKWDPRKEVPEKAPPETVDTEAVITFVEPERIKTLTDGFRIFTKGRTIPNPPDGVGLEILVPEGTTVAAFAIAGATDSAGTADATAGAGTKLIGTPTRELAVCVPEPLAQSTQSAEIIAALLSVRSTPPDVGLRIDSGKDSLLRALSTKLPAWEDRGWIETPNAGSLQALVAVLRARTAETKIAEGTNGLSQGGPVSEPQTQGRFPKGFSMLNSNINFLGRTE
ncbi:hypothetical protein B0H16DRAFT_1743249 [Mycena metata]|uniref:Uncharacterized protein n=1 Tax=Mycena metata TaxID=1033252 RepID=A0AAD7H6W7_9AGAR|nr:hypothetical protein B0H16DRAFT_1743249 [Mycena metata]